MLRKLFIISILLFPVLCAGQNSASTTKTSYSCFKKSLAEVLVELSTSADVNIAFDPALISPEYVISINATNETVEDIISVLLKDTNLKYEIVNQQVVIVPNPTTEEERIFIFSGYIEDRSSKERLAFANLYSVMSDMGVSANEYGFFSFSSVDSIVTLRFTYLGYEALSAKLDAKDKLHVISMTPNILLNEIVIEDTRLVKKENIEDVNTFPLHVLNNMTALGGDPDIIRLVGMQPGVSTGADGLGGINVRGGSVDQSLILMDGVPVYNTGHTLGMFSIFNTSMIKSARLYKDAFPAKYGGRLSSVLDIRTKEGNLEKYAGDISIGTISAKFTLEGPIVKNKSSFILSGRRSLIDPWIKTFSKSFKNAAGSDGAVVYNFHDLNAKFKFEIGNNSTLYLSYYQGRDVFGDETVIQNRQDSIAVFENFSTNWKWGNQIISARLSSKMGQKLFFSSTAYYTTFGFDAFKNEQTSFDVNGSFGGLVYEGSLFQSRISDFGYRMDFNYNANNQHQLQFGLDIVRHQFDPGLTVVNERDSVVRNDEVLERRDLENFLNPISESGIESNIYFEDKIKASDRIEIIAGLRGAYIRSRNRNYYALLPSIAVNTELTEDILFRMTYSRSNQFLHLLTTSGLGLPTDIWLPTTDDLQPQRSWQYSASLLTRILEFGYFEIGGFYKNMNRILTLREGPVFDINNTTEWENDIPTGTGLSYGIESTLVKNVGKFKGALSYTWSRSDRLFEEVNNGRPYPFRYDRRHMINSNFSYRINQNIELALNGLYLTGNPVTVPTNFSTPSEESPLFVSIFLEKNNIRLPDYKRVDLSVNIFNKYSWGRQKITLGVYNLFNWQNPLFYYVRRNENEIAKPERKQITILPIIPSLSYSLTF
jgi:hypothetical protein